MMANVDDLLRAAFKAVLNGDLTERDRLCELARHELDQDKRAVVGSMKSNPIELVRNGDGVYRPKS